VILRFNYCQSACERLLGEAAAVLLTHRMRVPLATIGAALLAVTATWSIESARVAGFERELAALQSRVSSASPDALRGERLIAAVTRLRALRAGVSEARRQALAATNTIAQLGNELPSRTWLTGVGSTPAGTWIIDGRSTRVGEIGTMLRRIASIDNGAAARLISIAATGRSRRILDFAIGWDRRP
jgi:hypothetical protein